MKRCIIPLAALLMLGQQSFSQDFPLIYDNPGASKDAVSLIWGDASCLNEKGKTILVLVDFDEAKVVEFDKAFNIENEIGSVDEYNRSHGEDYVRDWPSDRYTLAKSLTDKMNSAFKADFKLGGDPKEADYLFYLRVGLFDFGHFVFVGSFKDGGTITKGLVEIYDVNKEDCIAVLDVNYVCGRNVGYGNNDRFRQYGIYFSKAMKAAVK